MSLKREAETAIRKVDAQLIFDQGAIIISETDKQSERQTGKHGNRS